MLIHIPCASQLRICCSLSNTGHPQQFLDKGEASAKPKTTSPIRAVLQQRSPGTPAERRQKSDFLCQAGLCSATNRSSRADPIPVSVPVSRSQPSCPYPAAVRGHAAGAERRGARHGSLGSAASAPCVPCSIPCTAAAQGKRAASAGETRGGKGLMLRAKRGGSRKVQR